MFGISGYTPLKGFDAYIYMIGISWEYLTNTTIHGYDSNKNFSMNYSNLVATSLES
jgi:hypothetical protein